MKYDTSPAGVSRGRPKKRRIKASTLATKVLILMLLFFGVETLFLGARGLRRRWGKGPTPRNSIKMQTLVARVRVLTFLFGCAGVAGTVG